MSIVESPIAPLPALPTPAVSHRLVRQWFVRGLGGIYLIAIISLWMQIDGLIGNRGILPVREFLESLRLSAPGAGFWQAPTLCWLGASDGALHFLCAAGVVLALLVIAGFAQAPALALLWAIYLSLTVAGQDFFSFQWDALLLEAGFLAIFFAPLQLGPSLRRQPEPSRVVLWLLRWLTFRLMFLSGLLKLLSGDPAWRDGSAMDYHYLTQPLPTWTSYWAYRLPHAFQSASVWMMFAIELLAPMLMFIGVKSRRVAFIALVCLQGLILATGNFGFFNLLAILLCFTLLDDSAFPLRLRRWTGLEPAAPTPTADESPAPPRVRTSPRWPIAVTAPLAAVTLTLTTFAGVAQVDWRRLPRPALRLLVWSAPFRSTNGYGLFRVMTRERDEIIIEGSEDGRVWQEYGFKYKPGDVRRRPEFCTPDMPRLDWQMWFVPLDARDNQHWFLALLTRLLEGDRQVLGLMGTNPFPRRPPRYIRALIYNYTFAPPSEPGVWWRRRLVGVLVPSASLRSDEPENP